MCHATCIQFGQAHLSAEEIIGKSVLEVGARDVNGSLRPYIEELHPGSYIGVDVETGPGVDEICSAEDLVLRFGSECFDVVICTEVLEHVRNWHRICSNLKGVLKAGGLLLATTRSKGFSRHAYPYDYWRYELSDARAIFSDLDIMVLKADTMAPGIFVKACKPKQFSENNLKKYRLYSMIKLKRCTTVTWLDILLFKFLSKILSTPAKHALRRAIGRD
jgi:SAM-dependent methyltransferase